MAQLSLFDLLRAPFLHSKPNEAQAFDGDCEFDPFESVCIEYMGDGEAAEFPPEPEAFSALASEAPLLPWREEVSETAKRTARAQIKDGWIVVSLPKRWPKAQRAGTIETLRTDVQRQFTRDWQRVRQVEASENLISLSSMDALRPWVAQLNRETFQQPLAKIRIGQSKHSRLAQMNVTLRTLTVSKYCLKRVPEAALRYLIVHELAHLIEANHSRAFWALVAQYVPDYRKQSALMQAFHRIRVYES
jgi:Protein of unknown function DUF45